MKRLLLTVSLILCATGAADAQIGGTMLARQPRLPPPTMTIPLLTGNGQGLTFNGHGGTQ